MKPEICLSSLDRVLVIIATNLIVYFRLLRCKYIIDDTLIPKKKGKNTLQTLWFQFASLGYSDPAVEHLLRILNHTFNGVLMYFAFGANEVSFWAAMLWSINSVNNQGVGWLNGAGYAMTASCAFCMFIWPKLSLFFYLFMLWWHLTGVPLPLLFILRGQPWASLQIALIPIIGFFTAWRIPFNKVQRNATLAQRIQSSISIHKKLSMSKFPFALKMFGYYFLLSLIPWRLGLYHEFGYAYGLTEEDNKKCTKKDAFFVLSVFIIILTGVLIKALWNTPVSFGLAWFALLILPWCNILTFHQTVSDRYCYLPSAGLMLALSYLILQIPFAGVRWFIMGGFFIFYAVKTINYLFAYKDMETYMYYNLIEQPEQFSAWNWRGLIERSKGRIFAAMYAYAQGLRYRPHDFRLNANMADCFKQLGLYEQAYEYLQKAKEGMPDEVLESNLKILNEEENFFLQKMGKSGQGRIIVPK